MPSKKKLFQETSDRLRAELSRIDSEIKKFNATVEKAKITPPYTKRKSQIRNYRKLETLFRLCPSQASLPLK
jgi:hypothetical protein